ncbi:MAG TPA: enoyl-CoA hydratase-related protein [Actinomycetota bacterium]|nr:enoyl-CoA hydratase-related protein [Actinomycetota bacterium]
MAETIAVSSQGDVAVLTIDRPEVHNCVNAATAEGLTEAIENFARGPEKVLVVTGAGVKAFCTGADLKDAAGLLAHRYVERSGPMGFSRLDPGKPVIAAVNGYCFAGGMELAAWCDFRIASENAEFGALNRRWGVPFTDGGTQRFARVMGLGNALYLIESGVRIDAKVALRMGLVSEVVSEGQALPRALEIASRICDYPQVSLKADRESSIRGFGMSLEDGLDLEEELCLPATADPELQVGLGRFVRGDRPDALR